MKRYRNVAGTPSNIGPPQIQGAVLYDGSGNLLSASADADGVADSTAQTLTASHLYAYTGAAWDRLRNSNGAGMGAETATHNGFGLATHATLSVWNGATWVLLRTPIIFKTIAAVAITAATGATIWDPAAGKKFRLMGYCLSSTAAASFKFYEGLTTALTTLRFQGPLLAANGVHDCPPLGNGILSSTADMNLNLDVSATSTVSGTVWGTEE
jgi:hypothetical protein